MPRKPKQPADDPQLAEEVDEAVDEAADDGPPVKSSDGSVLHLRDIRSE